MQEGKVDVNATNDSGWTHLMVATHHKSHSKVIKALIAKGANVNVADEQTGNTPLMDAIINGYDLSVIKAMLDAGFIPLGTRIYVPNFSLFMTQISPNRNWPEDLVLCGQTDKGKNYSKP